MRPGPDINGMPANRALRAMPARAVRKESDAAPSHVAIHRSGVGWIRAIEAAVSAIRPMATPAHPETAVNDAERSIVSRMKRRLSIARS